LPRDISPFGELMNHLPSLIHVEKSIQCENPLLVQGLPGIGFVASVAVLHLIRKLKAEKFAEVFSPHFQDAVFATAEGDVRRPSIEFYLARIGNRDLILLYGNTQPLTRYGQYEVSGKSLDLVKSLGCQTVVSFAGLRRDQLQGPPKVFCTTSDFETLENALKEGVNTISGEVYGMAGIIIGLARLKEMHGLCLLTETLGTYPDQKAAKAVLEKFGALFELDFDLSDLDSAATSLKDRLETLRV